VRLRPGQDLRQGLEEAARAASVASAFVICGIGSLTDPRLRFAGAREETVLPGPFEMLSLSGTLTPGGCHLHMVVAGPDGRAWGGHVSRGNTIRTTAEVLLAALPDGVLSRRFDPRTGFMELVVQEPVAGGAHGAPAKGRAP
jgi:predicted DNA-binding protein with PD1-like motif